MLYAPMLGTNVETNVEWGKLRKLGKTKNCILSEGTFGDHLSLVIILSSWMAAITRDHKNLHTNVVHMNVTTHQC